MEFGTMAGIGGIFVAVLVSMVLEGSSPMAIFLLPALFLVFVGTFGAAMAGGLVRDLPTVARHARKALLGKPLDGEHGRRDDRRHGRPGPPRGAARPGGHGQGRRRPAAAPGDRAHRRRHRPRADRGDPRGPHRGQARRRQGRHQVLRRHGRLRPDARDHRHGHRPDPRPRQPQQPRAARPPHRRRVRRDAVGRPQRERHLAAAVQQAQADERVRGGPDGDGARGRPRRAVRHQPAAGGAEAALDPAGGHRGRAMRASLPRRRDGRPQEQAGARRGGARELRALAAHLRRHDHAAHGAVHRAVRDRPGRPEEVRQAARRPGQLLRRRDRPAGQRRRCWRAAPRRPPSRTTPSPGTRPCRARSRPR